MAVDAARQRGARSPVPPHVPHPANGRNDEPAVPGGEDPHDGPLVHGSGGGRRGGGGCPADRRLPLSDPPGLARVHREGDVAGEHRRGVHRKGDGLRQGEGRASHIERGARGRGSRGKPRLRFPHRRGGGPLGQDAGNRPGFVRLLRGGNGHPGRFPPGHADGDALEPAGDLRVREQPVRGARPLP